MTLSERHRQLRSLLSALDFDALFPGFHPYPFALYNRREICLDGRMLPYQEAFRGNTSILYEGQYTAIWDCESDSVEDAELLSSSLVHEMFHCHQGANGENGFPSDLALLNKPDGMELYTRKYNENLLLAECYEHGDMECLRQFTALREQRIRTYPDITVQELKAETIEGMAEYVGLKALREINRTKFDAKLREYTGLLRGKSNLLFDARRLSYYTGAVYLLCLGQLGHKIRYDFQSAQTVYEQNRIAANETQPTIQSFDFIREKYAALIREQEAIIAGHIAKSGYMECHARICGYDPMNMFRVGNLLYCSHFVCLTENGETSVYNTPVLLVMEDGSDWVVKGYYTENR